MATDSRARPVRIADVAEEHLRSTENNRVMWGDTRLLHEIAAKAGKAADGKKTEQQVLDALWRTPGRLVKGHVLLRNGRTVRCLWLPEASADVG